MKTPKGVLKYTVFIEPIEETWTVWEFNFRRKNKLVNEAWRTYAGFVDVQEKPGHIFINTDGYSKEDRQWTLEHEKFHILRHRQGWELDVSKWDEFETDLLALASVPEKSIPKFWREILLPLRGYLLNGPEGVPYRLRKLTNWLRDQSAEKEKFPNVSKSLLIDYFRTKRKDQKD